MICDDGQLFALVIHFVGYVFRQRIYLVEILLGLVDLVLSLLQNIAFQDYFLLKNELRLGLDCVPIGYSVHIVLIVLILPIDADVDFCVFLWQIGRGGGILSLNAGLVRGLIHTCFLLLRSQQKRVGVRFVSSRRGRALDVFILINTDIGVVAGHKYRLLFHGHHRGLVRDWLHG